MNLLENKNILIATSGSIAIYKTLELIRLFIKSGANVKVIMTKASQKFITPLTFETISQNKVLDTSSEDWSCQSSNNHIAIGKWADIFIIAPATANTINKLANGIADNLLLQTALAYPQIKLICPAANTNMIQNPLTQANLKMLKLCNFKIINSITKELACQDIGNGAMAEVQDIYHQTVRELLKDNFWTDRKVVLNGGGTLEKIDDVRFLTNFSSGKMANALASALYYKGADVCFVRGNHKESLQINDIHILDVQSTNEMLEYITNCIRVAKKGKMTNATLMDSSSIELIQKKPFFFSVAAVSDYTCKYPQSGKIKKDDIGENWNLELKKNIDILKAIDKNDIYTIGFKAEFDKQNGKTAALSMLKEKNLDGVCLNILGDGINFGSNNNNITLITKNNEYTFENDKLKVALEIINQLSKEFKE